MSSRVHKLKNAEARNFEKIWCLEREIDTLKKVNANLQGDLDSIRRHANDLTFELQKYIGPTFRVFGNAVDAKIGLNASLSVKEKRIVQMMVKSSLDRISEQLRDMGYSVSFPLVTISSKEDDD